MTNVSPPWLVAGLKDLGFHETGENQGIERFIADAHAGKIGDPWCAISACAWFERVGIRSPRSASSQSFRKDKHFVQLAGASLGAIAVYWRGKKPVPVETATTGHVGFYLGETATQVLTFGGNESDAVRKQFEPKARLIGYWWPKSVPLPVIAPIIVKDADGHPVGSVT